jgi:hypothetical protein
MTCAKCGLEILPYEEVVTCPMPDGHVHMHRECRKAWALSNAEMLFGLLHDYFSTLGGPKAAKLLNLLDELRRTIPRLDQ